MKGPGFNPPASPPTQKHYVRHTASGIGLQNATLEALMNCTSLMFTNYSLLRQVAGCESKCNTVLVLHPLLFHYIYGSTKIEKHVHMIESATVFSSVYQQFAPHAQRKSPGVQVSQSHWSVRMSKLRAHPKYYTGCVSGLALIGQ